MVRNRDKLTNDVKECSLQYVCASIGCDYVCRRGGCLNDKFVPQIGGGGGKCGGKPTRSIEVISCAGFARCMTFVAVTTSEPTPLTMTPG